MKKQKKTRKYTNTNQKTIYTAIDVTNDIFIESTMVVLNITDMCMCVQVYIDTQILENEMDFK